MSSQQNIAISATEKERFINREISWLAFNMRVLEEALNPAVPLAQRLNFLAISASNLDEFIMIRVSGLKDYVQQNITKKSQDGLTPTQELEEIYIRSSFMVQKQHECWQNLHASLKKEGISIIEFDELNNKDFDFLREYFLENIFPALTPIAIDPAHPFPFLPNLGLALIFQLKNENDGKKQISIVPLPARLPRFIEIPSKKMRFLRLESVIEAFLDILMPDFSKIDSALFRIIRDSELDVDEHADEDFLRNFEHAVKQRRRGKIVQIKFSSPAPRHLVQFVTEQMQIDVADIIEVSGILGISALRELIDQLPERLKFPAFNVRFPERINDYGGDCFAAIAAKDIVVHHPFESFDVVIQFLRQAAYDPDVISIKQTLYRTSRDSPIVKALIAAAEAGKSVTALVELKARFDEEANLQWARNLERAGVQVIYGFVKLKTHAKVSLITRKEGNKIISYAHFGTGNYHPTTAKIYTDLSFFTCDPDLCHDAACLFNYLTGYAPPKSFKKLIIAPRNMRGSLMQLIEAEINHARNKKPAAIWAKMNSLVDPDVIDALYKASQAGVKIELIIRGICCLRPAVKGLSENIRVKSIVGRFLEHSRIYCFGNGHSMPSPNSKVYIGSADWMPRNLDWRVEIMTPIENKTVHEQILEQIMVACINDEKQSWILAADGSYKRLPHSKNSPCAHDYFINNPSLSGRGKALQKRPNRKKLK